jgi:hypothetical protein
VFRDALALPQGTRKPKPWERASVPAHAPRLQGQKIWKKAGIKAQNNKENEAAFQELHSEGKGARKKQRLRTAKENIGNAPWKSGISATGDHAQDQESGAKSSENGVIEGQVNGKEEDALRFIPRKRTNTDHVITPRKPLMQTYLNGQAQTLLIRSPGTLAEKPARRRKSMRRSIRKSTSTRRSETSLFTPRKQNASSIESAAETALPGTAVNEPPETVSGTMLVGDSFAAQEGSRVGGRLGQDIIRQMATVAVKVPLNDCEEVLGDLSRELRSERLSSLDKQRAATHEFESIQPVKSHIEVRETIEGGMNNELSSIANAMETPRRGKQTRSRQSSSTKVEDPIVQNASTVDDTASRLQSHLLPHRSVAAESSCGDDISQGATYDISTVPTAQQTPIPSKPCAVRETVQLVGPSADPLEPCLEEQPGQDLLSGVELPNIPTSQGTIPHAETSPATSCSLEPLGCKVDQERMQTAELNALESPTTYPDVSKDDETVDDPDAGLAEQVVDPISTVDKGTSATASPVPSSVNAAVELSPSQTGNQSLVALETLKPADNTLTLNATNESTEDLPQSPTVDLLELVETISENAPSGSYDDEDTDMLRNFLTRVKANKAAKAEKAQGTRKRSLPHSPLQLPLGEIDTNTSPSPPRPRDEFDVGLPSSPTKRRKRDEPATDKEDAAEPKAIRRSGRTRLPVVKGLPAAPSLIPVRRLGQDGDTTITLRRNEEKELAALTRVNTRKNKGAAVLPAQFLILKAELKAEEAANPAALRQRLLKEVFDDKKNSEKGTKGKTVAWATALTQFQTANRGKVDGAKETDKDQTGCSAEKKGAVRVGARNKITLGKLVNGTPAPKRKTRDRT